jgi:MoxR-like ATPase
MTNKFTKIQEVLNKKYYERKDEIEGMLIAILSRQHVLLIGEAGTGKSLLSMELPKIIKGSEYFQWLLTKYSTPEELFGALSLESLEKGVHKRNTTGKLPEAEFGFLDEIFKANSAILNSLLTLINERLFYNNGTPVKSPLVSLIGASNEYPEEDEGLDALFDRFLLRYEVEPIKKRGNFISMLKGEGQELSVPSITLDELTDAQFHTELINVPDEIYEIIADIHQALADEAIYPSARRVKNSIQSLKAKAFLESRNEVEEKDLLIMKHVLWTDPEQKEIAKSIVKEFAQDKVSAQIERIEQDVKDIMSQFKNKDQSQNVYDVTKEVAQKLKVLSSELTTLAQENPKRTSEIKVLSDHIEKEQQRLIDDVLLPIEG